MTLAAGFRLGPYEVVSLSWRGRHGRGLPFSLSGLLPPNEAFLKARILARQALEMDDQSVEAHGSPCYALFNYDWDFADRRMW
jgi:hypothetical protein